MSLKIIAASHIIYRQNLVPMFLRCQKAVTAHTIIKVTRMHSSRLHTVRWSGRLSCHARPHCHAYQPAKHAPCHACPPPCTPPCHTCPHHAWPPCHACFPLPCMPPSHHACPPAMHAPLWTEFLTHACENITFPQLLLRTVIIGSQLPPPPTRVGDHLGNPGSATGNRIWSV